MLLPGSLIIIAVILIIYFRVVHSQTHNVDWTSIVTSMGDRLPDFSYCGYHASDISLPTVGSPDITLRLSGNSSNDFAPSIQKAIETVARSGGGVVELPPGRVSISAGIQLRSNVVVTGSKEGETILVVKGQPSKPVFTLGSKGNAADANYGARSSIVDDYVPIGSSEINIVDSSEFTANQPVYISRDATALWIRDNGMLGLVQDGVAQTWIPEGKTIMSPNEIKAINGTKVTLKIPLTDALDSRYMKPEMIAYTPPAVNSEMGLQNFRIEVPETCSGTSLDGDACNQAAVRFPSWTVDSWASGLTLEGFNQFFEVQQDASRITIQNSNMDRNLDINGSALPFDILIGGSQVLIQDCEQVGLPTARCFSVGTGSLTAGPNAVTGHVTRSDVQTIYPHQRWAYGLLVEKTSVPVLFLNRAMNGTGQGWAINAGVGWNLEGENVFESPPLGINWCVGCGGKGGARGNATHVSPGKRVTPGSLFAAQLEARGAR